MKTLLLIAALAFACARGYSQTNEYYGSKEFELGAAATWTTASDSFDITDGVVGVTVNGTKYFNQYAGVTAEIGVVDLYNIGNLLIDQVNLGGTLRYPIGRVAPYARALVGRDFHQALYLFSAGAGLEYRLTKNLGVFTEGRYQWWIDNSDRILFLGGVSLAF
jgi:hypothetical protein